jgi:uncharacterized protein (DUF342 family)
MISTSELREYMRSRLEEERSRKSIRVSGASVQDALRQASIELGLPIKKLQYELLERGSRGFLGAGKKEFELLVYELVEEKAAAEAAADLEAFDFETEKQFLPEDKDGEIFVRLTHEGAFLKVTRPLGRGEKAGEHAAMDKLLLRGVSDIDKSQVARVVRHADGEFIRVGQAEYNPANQSVLTIDIADQDMKAYMNVSPPGPGGPDLTREDIQGMLNSHGVVHGVRQEVIQEFLDSPHYNEKILVATGTPPVNGQDAKIIYNFTIDHSKLQLKEKDGRVDFKDLDLVDNVEAGQILARKVPKEMGQDGSSVTGKVLPARAGRDVEIGVGKNVRIAEDGITALATINGQAILAAGKINVEPIYTVPGDVNFKTGNILFLGTVMVKGNVEDGFSVKAAGNIEVMGSVGKCELDAEGDVIVHQGILGKNSGNVRAGSNIIAKFIEHSRVEAENSVIVSDGIIHSSVDANRRIICQGKRASIVGGKIRATEEINAKTFGSVAGTETILEVGYDPKRKEQLAVLTGKKETIEKQLEEIERNIKTLETLKKVQRNFSEEKQKDLQDQSDQRSALLAELTELNREIQEISGYLLALKTVGRISASDRVYPGVKLFIKNESLTIRNEFRKVTFVLEGSEIRMTKYEPVGVDRRV